MTIAELFTANYYVLLNMGSICILGTRGIGTKSRLRASYLEYSIFVGLETSGIGTTYKFSHCQLLTMFKNNSHYLYI